MRGLTGKRVLVTRAADRAGEMVALLAEQGADAVLLPIIRAVAVDDAAPLEHVLRRLVAYDWLVFTSATAVQVVFAAMRGARVASMPPTLRIAAVGTATASAVAAHGARAHLVPDVFRGEELGRAIEATRATRILFPRADIARAETLAALRATGAHVDDVVVYRTALAEPDAALDGVIEGVDVITFTSPSTVQGLVQATHGALPALASKTVIATIGPTTSAAAREHGLPVHVEASVHTAAALVRDLYAWLAATDASVG